MGCDMCGKESELFRVSIENSRMNVCKDCSAYGEILEKVDVNREYVKPARFVRPEEPVEFVVGDYSEKIRKARERMGLSHKDFAQRLREKESVIHKIECGGIVPELIMAKKIERICGIKLLDIE